jgi:crotonobetainyl-CoA:carnitine CoA-transferase CaiB-like acyl-CoA transferase
MSVFGVCLGLFHRERSGAGQRVWTSLLGCSAMMQSGELVRVPGRKPAIRGGCDFRGPTALDRFYATRDGWLRLQAPDLAALRGAGIPKTESLSDWLAAKPTSEAVACLTSAGIPCVEARLPGDLAEDPEIRKLEMFATLSMQDGTPFLVANRYARFSRTQTTTVFTPPGVGEHSREVLMESGVSPDDIEALVASGALKQGKPFQVAAIQNYR